MIAFLARLIVTFVAADAGEVLHLSVQGETITGAYELWSCLGGCRREWRAVDGVRIGPAERSRCGL